MEQTSSTSFAIFMKESKVPSFNSFILNEARKKIKNGKITYKLGGNVLIINPTGEDITQKYV